MMRSLSLALCLWIFSASGLQAARLRTALYLMDANETDIIDTPSGIPTPAPSLFSTPDPSSVPTAQPTGSATSPGPTGVPTTAAAAPTGIPTSRPSGKATYPEPTGVPTRASVSPTGIPTSRPTGNPEPTGVPTRASVSPTGFPTPQPTPDPTAAPVSPTLEPTLTPTSVPTLNPTLEPTVAPSLAFLSDDFTDHPSGTPTEDPFISKLGDTRLFGKSVDKIIIGVAAASSFLIVVMLIVGSLRGCCKGSSGSYVSVASPPAARPKRSMFKKFEDYWDEESEDQSSRSEVNAKGASTNYEDYWDEKNDLSTHSNHPLNISLPKRP